jgi:hypothetical protein
MNRDATTDRVATFHVSLPLGHPAIQEITRDWTKEEYSAAMDDVLRYGNVCVVDGYYVSWDTGKRLRHA